MDKKNLLSGGNPESRYKFVPIRKDNGNYSLKVCPLTVTRTSL